MWLVKCLKILVSEDLAIINMLDSLKHRPAALPLYCFITLVKVELKNVHLSLS